MLKKGLPKNAVFFRCEDCYFECSKKSNYEKHLITQKHLFNTVNKTSNSENATPELVLNCEYCNKKYKSRVGLWYHNKKCIGEKNISTESSIGLSSDTEINTIISDNEAFKKLILEIVKSNTDLQKQNSELQKQMIEVCKSSNSINNSNINLTANIKTIKYNKTNFSKYNFIVIVYYYIYFINQTIFIHCVLLFLQYLNL